MNDNTVNLPRRKLVQISPSDVTVVPQVDQLISDALSIIGAELAFYRGKAKRGINLDLKEAKVVQSYVEALVKLNKEARESSKNEDLSNLSNEELLSLAENLVAKSSKE